MLNQKQIEKEIEKKYKKWLESDIDNYGTIDSQEVGFIAGFEQALLSQKQEFEKMINEIDLSWFRQIINEKLPLDKSISDFKEIFKQKLGEMK